MYQDIEYLNNFKKMQGKTITSIQGIEKGNEEAFIHTKEGLTGHFYHEQDCCESVYLADFEGDPSDLIGATILEIQELTDEDGYIKTRRLIDDSFAPTYDGESYTYTFYNIKTTKGYLWLRWIGESNGYYSEEMTFELLGE